MTSTVTLATFAVAFVAGPALFWLLTRLAPSGLTLALLGLGMAIAMVAAFGLLGSRPLVSLASLWLSWVLTLALMVLALGRRAQSPRVRHRSFTAGLLATTLPWFGLATARMVSS